MIDITPQFLWPRQFNFACRSACCCFACSQKSSNHRTCRWNHYGTCNAWMTYSEHWFGTAPINDFIRQDTFHILTCYITGTCVQNWVFIFVMNFHGMLYHECCEKQLRWMYTKPLGCCDMHTFIVVHATLQNDGVLIYLYDSLCLLFEKDLTQFVNNLLGLRTGVFPDRKNSTITASKLGVPIKSSKESWICTWWCNTSRDTSDMK